MTSDDEERACLGDDTIARFLEGVLGPEKKRYAQSHVDVCEACRGLLADAVDLRSREIPAPRPARIEAVMPGQILAGKYEILRVIGTGGMGRVLAARHVGLDKHVAIKVMHPGALADEDAVRRFMREARAAARLTSEHAVRVYDVDQLPSGQPFLVMELLEGEDLHGLQERRALGVEEAIGYIVQATEALVEAHAIGLIHRDIKPHNLFLVRQNDGRTQIKVIDFGLAKELGRTPEVGSATSDQMILGSPEYMSPEQVRSPSNVDGRTDIWALGATLFKLLTGRPPFEAPTVVALLARILTSPTPSARAYRPDTPAQIDQVLTRALEKSIEARYQSVQALGDALRGVAFVTDAEGSAQKAIVSVAETKPGVDHTVELPDRAANAVPLELRATVTVPGASVDMRRRPALVGRFRLLDELGSGGMGDVYRAHDPLLDRLVALKLLRGADEDQRRRVVREARAAAALTHPNTVTIFDVGEGVDGVFIAMELLVGESLRATLARGDASLREKLRWLRESARALAAAHAGGLVHRDVKPENMFVCVDGSLKLLDFGIAKRETDHRDGTHGPPPESLGPSSMQTSAGRRLGTPRYMAPEQRAGRPTDARTDQYAWGLVAFELLSGSTTSADSPEPSDDERRRAMLAEVRGLPDALGTMVLRTLAAAKEARFASMNEIVALLEAMEAPAAREATVAVSHPVSVDAEVPRSDAWKRLAVASVVAMVVLAAAGSLVRRYVLRPARAVACAVAPSRLVTVGPYDRVGLDASGALLVARDLRGAPKVEREVPGGWTPLQHAERELRGGWPVTDLTLAGSRYADEPVTVMVMSQGREEGALVKVVDEAGTLSHSLRVFGPISGLTLTYFRDSPVVISSAEAGMPRRAGKPGAIEAHRLRLNDTKTLALGGGTDPSVAAGADQLALAYLAPEGIRFALFDKELVASGAPLTISPWRAAPALAFDGATVTAFWIEQREGSAHLMSSSLTVGHTGFTAPRRAIDDAVAPGRPLAVELANRRWGLAWVARAEGASSLRFARIDETGRLAPAIEVARAATIVALQAAFGGGDSPTLSWSTGESAVHAARIACTSQP